MTQIDVAAALDVGQSAVTKWETGKSTPTKPNLLRFAALVKAPLDVLLAGEAADYDAMRQADALARKPVTGPPPLSAFKQHAINEVIATIPHLETHQVHLILGWLRSFNAQRTSSKGARDADPQTTAAPAPVARRKK